MTHIPNTAPSENPDRPPARALGPADYAHAGALLARAFDRDPMWTYLFPDAIRRTAQMTWFFERWCRALAPLGGSYITGGGEGVILWLPPAHSPDIGLGRLLRAGLGRAPFHFGAGWLYRVGRIQAALGDVHRVLVPPHWQINVLGVDPSCQRRGVGRALLQHSFGQIEPQHLPLYVITHNPANVPYYEQHGFRAVRQRVDSRSGVFACALRREPV